MHFTCVAQNTKQLHLQLVGKDSTETSILDSLNYSKRFDNYIALTKEIDSVQNTLLFKGYFDHSFLGTEKKSDTLVIGKFELNTLYPQIRLYYDSPFVSEEIITQYAVSAEADNFTIRTSDATTTLKLLTNYLVNLGMTFSTLHLSSIRKKNNQLVANLVLSESKSRTLDNFVLKGYDKFPESFLHRYANIKKGKTFKKQEIIEKTSRLDNLKFVKNSKPPEVLFNKDSTTVYFYLKKQAANTFDGFLGFSSDNENNNLELNGYLNLHLLNNLNFGEELRLIYKNDGNDQQRFEVHTALPYLLKSPLGIEAGLQIFRRDTTFLITEQNININYHIKDKSKLFIGYQTTESSNLLDIPQPNLLIDDYNSEFIRAGLTYSKAQNNSLFPIKTHYALLTQFGSRKTGAENTRQTKGIFDVSHIFTLNRRNSIFIKNQAAAIFSDQFLINELYRFGGINSMRGFEENTINASLYNVLNTEYRYILSANLYIHSIIDYSYFEDDSNALSDNLTSFGFGLGLKTGTGIFRIIFANGKTSNQNFDFSNTKVHLSLNANF